MNGEHICHTPTLRRHLNTELNQYVHRAAAAELRLAAAGLVGNAAAVEYLTARADTLERQAHR